MLRSLKQMLERFGKKSPQQGYNPLVVANKIEQCSNESPLPEVKLQRLLYFSHAFMLGYHSRPLLNEELSTGVSGPICFTVLDANGSRYVAEGSLDPDAMDIIESTVKAFDDIDDVDMLNLIQAEEGPWHRSKNNNKTKVSNKYIKDYYATLVNIT